MTVAELIHALQQLPPDYEVAVLAASAMPRPIEVCRVTEWAFRGESDGQGKQWSGFKDPRHAFLLRPLREMI